MDQLASDQFPPDVVEASVPFDTTRFVRSAIGVRSVSDALRGARSWSRWWSSCSCRSWRATLIPMLAVPVSLIGTLRRTCCGHGLRDQPVLTLFAMVLAIGIVVDDAIVVLENVERLMRDARAERPARPRSRRSARGVRRARRHRAAC
jgi:HAE1 family hydrophobic/amphiphilic exporter-1/multidrug efflux pump